MIDLAISRLLLLVERPYLPSLVRVLNFYCSATPVIIIIIVRGLLQRNLSILTHIAIWKSTNKVRLKGTVCVILFLQSKFKAAFL